MGNHGGVSVYRHCLHIHAGISRNKLERVFRILAYYGTEVIY